MTRTMILMGVLAICAVSGLLLKRWWTPGRGEPTGSYTAPTPPSPPPAPAAPSLPPTPAAAAPKPSQPLAAEITVVPPPPPPAPARRGRNSGFARFTPAPARARTDRA